MSIQTSFTSKDETPIIPTSFGGCDFWLDATDTQTITSSQTLVTGWRNKGTRSFTAGVAAGNPTTGTTWNGLNYISCPIGSRMSFSSAFGSSGEQTWFVVARGLTEVTGTTAVCHFMRNAAGDSFTIRKNTTSVNGIFQLGLYRAGVAQLLSDPTAQTTSTTLRVGDPYGNVMSYCAILDNKQPASVHHLSVCGGGSLPLTTSASSASGFITASSTYTIGDVNASMGFDFFEIIRYSRALSTLEREAIEGYIAWKYQFRTRDERSFIPTSIPNCALWLDAGYGSEFSTNFTGTTSAITSWLDKSGNGRHATRVTLTDTIPLVSAGIKDRRAVRLATADLLSSTPMTCSLSVGTTQPLTLFAVSYPTTGTRTIPISVNSNPGPVGNLFSITMSSTTGSWIASGFNTSTNGNQNGQVALFPRPDILCAYWSPGSSQIFINGAARPPSMATPTSLRENATTLIGAVHNGSSIAGNGGQFLYEVIVYTDTLTENQRKLVERYLANKWGLPLFTTPMYSHPFRTFAPFQKPFSPPDFGHPLYLWLDASDENTVSVSGSTISNIVDKSGVGSTISILNTPTWSATAMNGRPAFDMTNGCLSTAFIHTLTANPITCIVVASLNSYPSADNSCVAIRTSTGTEGFRVCDVQASNFQTAFFAGGNAYTRTTARSSLNTPFIFSSHSVLQGSIYYIGSALQDGTNDTWSISGSSFATPPSLTLTALRVGGNLGSTFTTNTWPGHVSEVILYAGFLSESEHEQIVGYLSWKWGIPLASTYPFYRVPANQGKRFDPTALTVSLQVWLDASEPNGSQKQPGPALNSAITRWEDKSLSSSGCHMSVRAGSVTYVEDEGYPALYFNGSSYLRSIDVGNVTVSLGSQTIIVVGRTTLPTNTFQRMYQNTKAISASAYRTIYVDAQSSNGNMGMYHSGIGNYNLSSNYISSSERGLHMLNGLFSQTNYYLNGTPIPLGSTAGSGSTSTADAGYVFVGAAIDPTNGTTVQGYLTGYVNEIIVIPVNLFNKDYTHDRFRIEGYLAWKWGIQNKLPASHPFKSIPP